MHISTNSTNLRLSENETKIGKESYESVASLQQRTITFKWIPCSFTEIDIHSELSRFGQIEEMKLHFSENK